VGQVRGARRRCPIQTPTSWTRKRSSESWRGRPLYSPGRSKKKKASKRQSPVAWSAEAEGGSCAKRCARRRTSMGKGLTRRGGGSAFFHDRNRECRRKSSSPKAFRRGSTAPTRVNACAIWRTASSSVRDRTGRSRGAIRPVRYWLAKMRRTGMGSPGTSERLGRMPSPAQKRSQRIQAAEEEAIRCEDVLARIAAVTARQSSSRETRDRESEVARRCSGDKRSRNGLATEHRRDPNADLHRQPSRWSDREHSRAGGRSDGSAGARRPGGGGKRERC
jgi:hypothetical protein